MLTADLNDHDEKVIRKRQMKRIHQRRRLLRGVMCSNTMFHRKKGVIKRDRSAGGSKTGSAANKGSTPSSLSTMCLSVVLLLRLAAALLIINTQKSRFLMSCFDTYTMNV